MHAFLFLIGLSIGQSLAESTPAPIPVLESYPLADEAYGPALRPYLRLSPESLEGAVSMCDEEYFVAWFKGEKALAFLTDYLAEAERLTLHLLRMDAELVRRVPAKGHAQYDASREHLLMFREATAMREGLLQRASAEMQGPISPREVCRGAVAYGFSAVWFYRAAERIFLAH